MHFVISILQIASDDQRSKGYGFVHFEIQEVARSAIEKLNGMMLNLKKCTSSHLNLMNVVFCLLISVTFSMAALWNVSCHVRSALTP